MRQIILDTETTGLEPEQGHRIIEIGCVEIVNRRPTGRTFHRYVNPEREIDAAAVDVHGLTNEFLSHKPLFGEIAGEFIDFVADSELIIHNAPFDVGFINAELLRVHGDGAAIEQHCQVLDTLEMARRRHPGQRNSLDALCKRYNVDNSRRDYHGALLDAQLLAEVYLAMTGGQAALSLGRRGADATGARVEVRRVRREGIALVVVAASEAEAAAHEQFLDRLQAQSGQCLWRGRAGGGTN